MSERFDDLLSQYLEGDLDASGTEELDRLLEKTLGGDGEKLRGVGGPVGVEQVSAPQGGIPAQLLVLVAEHARPCPVMTAVFEAGSAIRRTVLKIEQVGKLMERDIEPAVHLRSSPAHVVPGEDRDAAHPRLAEPHLLALLDDSAPFPLKMPGDVGARINEDGDQPRVVVGVPVQE